LVVPNLLLGNTILLTNQKPPAQALRIGEIIDAGELPPASRRANAATGKPNAVR